MRAALADQEEEERAATAALPHRQLEAEDVELTEFFDMYAADATEENRAAYLEGISKMEGRECPEKTALLACKRLLEAATPEQEEAALATLVELGEQGMAECAEMAALAAQASAERAAMAALAEQMEVERAAMAALTAEEEVDERAAMAALSARWQKDERAREAALSLHADDSDADDQEESDQKGEVETQESAHHEDQEEASPDNELEEEYEAREDDQFFECASNVDFVPAHLAN